MTEISKGFHPWVGPSYNSQDYKLLVLGQSHHYEGREPGRLPMGEERNDTITYTEKYLSGESAGFAFWSKVGSLAAQFAGWDSGSSYFDPREAFKKIAFYNFLISSVSDSRDEPSLQDVLDSRPVFLEVLDTLKPHFVIALGIERQPWFLSDIDGIDYLHTTERPFVVRRGESAIVVCNHPSGAFSYDGALDLLRSGRAIAEASK